MLKKKIQNDLKEAVKKKEEIRISVLRLLLTAILNREKEKRYKLTRQTFPSENLGGRDKGKPEISEKELIKQSQLSDEEVLEVILAEIKKRKEAILEFEKGKREDLAEKEKKELEILEKYLPEQLSEEEIKKIAKKAIGKLGAKELKDLGRVMAELMPKVKGRADGNLVSQVVKNLLSSNK